MENASKHQTFPAFLIFTIIFWLVGIPVLFITPFNNYPDEYSHFHYAKRLRVQHDLPPLDYSGKNLIPESFQPPLFYLVASLSYIPSLPDESNVYVIRFLCLFFGWLTVWITWKTALVVFAQEQAPAMLATAFVALNAQFLFIHTGISNIALTSFLGGLTNFFAVSILYAENSWTRKSLYMGLSLGGAVLSRITAIYLLPVCLGVLIFRWLKERSKSRVVQSTIVFVLGTFLVSGWWFLRNWLYYDDPILWKFHQQIIGKDFVRTEPVTISSLAISAAYLNASFWAFFGKQQHHAGITEYCMYFFLQVMACVGAIHLLLFRGSTMRRELSNKGFAAMFGSAICAIVEVLWIQTKISAPQGRYFYMAITPIAIVLAGGILQLIPSEFRWNASLVLMLFLLLMCIYLLLRYWLPRYATLL